MHYLWLSPTAEVPLTAFHRNEIIDPKIYLLSMLHIAHALGEKQGVMEKILKV